jgi:hypothetical protein
MKRRTLSGSNIGGIAETQVVQERLEENTADPMEKGL